MSDCHNCGELNAEFDCNGLKFCDIDCFTEWDREEQASLDLFAKEYEAFYIRGERQDNGKAIGDE